MKRATLHFNRLVTLVLLTCTLSLSTAFAQAPQKMSYQAVIRDGSGILVTSTQIGMEINIRQGSETGTVVYTETQTPTTNANGLVSIEIGGGAGFSTISWASNSYYIETKTAVVAPLTTYTITGVSQLLSVPYALYSANSGGFTHYIGELYGGGIVVSVWKESGVEHGLIASLIDVSTPIIWTTPAYQTTTVPEGATSPTDGLANSNAIVAQAGAGTTYAAGICRAYSATGDGGLNDWYLPASWEINQCYNAAFVANAILGATNGFKVAYYWSSTEYGFDLAWNQGFAAGATNFDSKDYAGRVRAVRRF